ncbi:PAS domain-containing protein [Kordiimonas sp. SCSIO 12603]|uniref:PAS domain-containing protein n=1 Tax=Kordiimonas sp. SCSIO 12603 TaxID=2829596 RepID=UPI0021022322|nr:PAS domain-containing protein [Kordiimonas sp. SCSIO 12603]UTW59963.1 PAS domain-containing protein [Kordiimonas sp. SCSIO 12603]
MYISKREFLELLKCWQDMPKTLSHTPAKTTFTPSSISKLLPHVFLMKQNRDGEFQLRLIGTELETMLGGKEASRSRFQQLARDENDFFGEFVNRSMKEPIGGLLSQKIKLGEEGYIRFEAFTVPLADKAGVPRYVLGAVSAERHFLNPPLQGGIHEEPRINFFDLNAADLELGIRNHFVQQEEMAAETTAQYIVH